MKKWVCFFFLILSFPFLQLLKAQNISNEGTDFWAVFPTHDPANESSLANITIFVTSKSFATVTVSCGGISLSKDVPANISVGFDLPRDTAYISSIQGNRILPNKGIHIVVKDGKTKVAAYAHIYAGKRSAASLILPVEAVGQRYYSMNYIQDALEPGRTYIALVATEDDTKILIHGPDKVDTISFRKRGEVYEYIVDAGTDITGTYVEVDSSSACKKFAMFSGVTSTKIGVCDKINSRDPLYQQLYPVNSWGKNYGIVPFKDRNYFLRILAQEDGTIVNFNGTTISLNKGGFITTPVMTSAGFVSSNKNISVAQFALSYSCMGKAGDYGDPDMVMLNPIEFSIKQVTLFSSKKEDIKERYINVCMKTSGTASFRIAGLVPSEVWTVLPANPLYSFIQLSVNQESIFLTADVGFNAIAYGFGSAESYAYSAGTNLASDNYFLVTNPVTHTNAPDACIREPSDFKIVLPYTVNKITWKLNNEPEDSYFFPVADTLNINGEILYSYLYPKNKLFSDVGTDTMYVVADLKPTIGGCPSGTEEFNFAFQVDALPTPITQFPAEVCPGYATVFEDKSTSNTIGKSITTWQWDFGDGSPVSTEQNPLHTYDSGGKYAVKLVVGTETGCKSEVRTDTIIVRPKMTAKISSSLDVCVNTNLEIKNNSRIEAGGKISKWIWDFGDGTTTVKTDSSKFYHKYKSTGKYAIVLITESEIGACRSFPDTSIITVHALPKVDFSVPKVCLLDNSANFVTTAENENSTDNGLTYSWNYGDAHVAPSLNMSYGKNGSHYYAQTGNYMVSLTVFNQFGCDSTMSHTITVSGSDPHANFEVLNKNKLCSNKEVVVRNLSFVSQGVITKLVWYPDINKPLEADTIDNPEPDQLQRFHYKAFSDQLSKEITIRLKAYSGGVCSNDTTITFTLWATPSIKFDQPAPVCIDLPKFKLVASEIAGLPGKGAFSGPGVSEDGWFDPAAAGVSAEGHEITYTFKSDNSDCTASLSRNIMVMPVPKLDVDHDVYLLAGGQKRVTAIAAGLNLRYKWFPSVGLDKDDISNPLITIDRDMQYNLTVTSTNGCDVSKQIYVHVLNSIEVANTFSPNGDGINDYWHIKYLDTYANATVEIFDRYGAKVFFSRGYSVPFDGTFNNHPLPVGTYYYIIDPKNGKQKKSGSLTLIR